MPLQKQHLALVILALAGTIAAADDKAPKEVLSPTGQLRLAVNDLATGVRVEDGPFTKYLSFSTWCWDYVETDVGGRKTRTLKFSAERLATARIAFRWWFGHVSGSKSIVREQEVAGSFGTLVKIDIRDAANWTRAAWEVVGNRDYLFREPWLPHAETDFLRLATAVKQNEKTLAAVSILNAYQLFRDGCEATRQDPKGVNSTYYDLLYAAERHPDGDLVVQVIPKAVGPAPERPAERPWKGGPWTGEGPDKGRYFAPGAFHYTPKEELEAYEKALAEWKSAKADAELLPKAGAPGKGIKNFPATGKDFEARWDAEVSEADLKRFFVDPRFGEIARGSENDPSRGSFVRINDGFITLTRTRFGWAGRTYDVRENTGERDHLARILEVIKGDAKADAGELLASLPNGAQAALLVNGQDERVEIAASDIAQARGVKVDKFADVRTHASCMVCHAPSGGFIPFVGAIKDSIKNGTGLRVDNDANTQRIRDFIERLEEDVADFPSKYNSYTLSTTRTRDNPKGWAPAQAVKEFQRARDWFDLPVGRDLAAAEFGVSDNDLRDLLLDLGQGKGPIRESAKTRVNQLATGQAIPRRTWEVDTATDIGLILSSVSTLHEPLKELVSKQLLDDALKRFGAHK